LTSSRDMADYFESTLETKGQSGTISAPELEAFAKSASNWILGDISRLMNLENGDVAGLRVTPVHLFELISLVEDGSISVTMAKTVLEDAFATGDSPVKIVKEKGYTQISDSASVKTVVAEAIAANPKAVADFMNGKDTATRYLVGQVMKITKGQAKPELVNQLVLESLAELIEKS